MKNKYLEILTQVVRHPRHSATGESALRVEIGRAGSVPSGGEAPQIVDFSRGGCRLRWHMPLQKGEPVTIRLCDAASGLALEFSATVRWARALSRGRFEAGCKFCQEVDYEHLGELFLAGFLSRDETTA